jgi:hypothetical protein
MSQERRPRDRPGVEVIIRRGGHWEVRSGGNKRWSGERQGAEVIFRRGGPEWRQIRGVQ